MASAKATSIRIFLADGRPDGLRLVDKSNWTGRAVVASRSDYPRVRVREEFGRPSIYVLSGPSDAGSLLPRIYIGEADVPRKRLDNHLAAKDFWTRTVLFTSKDGTLNKAHSRYIEARLIQLALDAKAAEVENGNAPALPPLSEADAADAEAFLEETLVLYPLMEVTAFKVPTPGDPSDERLRLKGPEASGEGPETSDGFVVFAGAVARPESVPSIHGFLEDLRNKLEEQGVLTEESGRLVLTKDHVFNSPSTAAGVLLGRAANGRSSQGAKQVKRPEASPRARST